MTTAPIFTRPVDAPEVFGISRATLYRWTRAGHVTMHKRGSMSFVRTDEVVAYIEGQPPTENGAKLGDRLGD